MSQSVRKWRKIYPSPFIVTRRGLTRHISIKFDDIIFVLKIIVLMFATYFCAKKCDASLRKTRSSWKKMYNPNLSVPLLFTLFAGSALWLIQGKAKQSEGWGTLLQTNSFFRLESYSNKPNAYQWSKIIRKEMLKFLFRSKVKSLTRCWRPNGLSFSAYFLSCTLIS